MWYYFFHFRSTCYCCRCDGWPFASRIRQWAIVGNVLQLFVAVYSTLLGIVIQPSCSYLPSIVKKAWLAVSAIPTLGIRKIIGQSAARIFNFTIPRVWNLSNCIPLVICYTSSQLVFQNSVAIFVINIVVN